MGDLSDFGRGQIVGMCVAGAYVTKIATLLGVSRASVSKVMSACKNHGEDGKTTSAKRKSGRKSALTERDHRTLKRTVSKNHITTTVQVTPELNILLEDPVSTKTGHDLHKSNIHSMAAIC
jgi:predicted transcriptional regulator